jgi:zinc-binding alcohol dehydrogenase/oxidoreductase
MKAFVHGGPPGFANTAYTDMEEREPGPGEVIVRLRAAGLNHRDLFMIERPRENAAPVVLGSDGAGIVDAVGEGVRNVRRGDEVVVNPSLRWPEKSDAPPPGFEVLGVPTHGTFAEKILLPAANVERKPSYLSWEEAGVLPLAALTAYRALFTRGKVKPGDTVLIPGIGSGVATFLLQMAKAVGARVWVTSRSENKRQRALELGADRALDSNTDWKESLNGERADLVIDSVGPATWNQSLRVLRPGGTMVTFGGSSGDVITMNIRTFFYGQYNLLGTTMGSAEEFREMLQFVEQHRIRPVIDSVYPLAEAKEALRRLAAAEQFGKIGLRME